MLQKSKVVTESLYDLRAADFSIRHHFELKTDDVPEYSKGRRQSPKHKMIVWEELQKMLKAGIIVEVTSEWTM